MANLLQASQVYSHRPIALKEAPDAWETVASIADTLFESETKIACHAATIAQFSSDYRLKLASSLLGAGR